jgi:hypothetical protein
MAGAGCIPLQPATSEVNKIPHYQLLTYPKGSRKAKRSTSAIDNNCIAFQAEDLNA